MNNTEDRKALATPGRLARLDDLEHQIGVYLIAAQRAMTRRDRNYWLLRASNFAASCEAERLHLLLPPRFVSVPIHTTRGYTFDFYECRLGPRGGKQERRWQKGRAQFVQWRKAEATLRRWKLREDEENKTFWTGRCNCYRGHNSNSGRCHARAFFTLPERKGVCDACWDGCAHAEVTS